MSGSASVKGRRVIVVGDKTTTGGTVISGATNAVYRQVQQARKGDKVYCPQCNEIGFIVEGCNELLNAGIPVALHGHIVSCGCSYGTNRVIAGSS